MATPGALPASALTTINGGGQLPHNGAARFRKADDALLASFGFRMRVLPTYGPYRTRARQRKINPTVPPDASEHCVIVSPTRGPVCAADIDNHRTFRMISETRFLNALHAAGIYFHVAGEGWHATIPNTPISAAAGGSATLTTTLEDEDMPVIYLDPTTKKYRIAGPDLPDRPALDVRTGKPLDGNQVLAVNAFLLKQPPYYPNGKQGAAVFPSEDVRKVILGVLGWL